MRFPDFELFSDILKYISFFFGALLVWLFQCVLPAEISFLGGSSIPGGWLLLLLFAGAFTFPDERAVVLGIFCGLLLDVSNHTQFAIGQHMCSYGIAGFLIGTQSRIVNQIPIQFFLALSMTFLLFTLDYLTVQWSLNNSLLHTSLRVWNRILASSAFNALVVLTLFPFLRWAWSQRFLQRLLRRSRSINYVA